MSSDPTLQAPKVTRYDLVRTLGKSQRAKVMLALHSLTGTPVAIKIYHKRKRQRRTCLAREVACLKALCHPHIVRLFHVMDGPSQLWIVTEYVEGGTLQDYLYQTRRLAEGEARRLLRQVLAAVGYCYAQGIAHRDLKPSNVLLDAQRNAKLADFGLSTQCAPDQLLDTYCGSPDYAAPELYLHDRYTGPAVDIWSLGVTLFRMVTGTMPFAGQELWQLRNEVIKAEVHIPSELSPECRDLIATMLAKDPQQRGSIESVRRHPWVRAEEAAPPAAPAYEYHDAATVETMLRMGFRRDAVHSSISGRRFNYTMGTYLILRWRQQEEAAEAQRLAGPGPPGPDAEGHTRWPTLDLLRQLQFSTRKMLPVAPGVPPAQDSGVEETASCISLGRHPEHWSTPVPGPRPEGPAESSAAPTPAAGPLKPARKGAPTWAWRLLFWRHKISPEDRSLRDQGEGPRAPSGLGPGQAEERPSGDQGAGPGAPAQRGPGRPTGAGRLVECLLQACWLCPPASGSRRGSKGSPSTGR